MKYLIILLTAFLLTSCQEECNINEMWREKIHLSNDSYIIMYHDWDCSSKKPLFWNKENKAEFTQMKGDIFHSCFDVCEMRLLVDITLHNECVRNFYLHKYHYMLEGIDWEYELSRSNYIDTAFRPHICYYAYRGDSIIPLATPYRHK